MNQNLVNPYQWLSDQISEVKDLVKTIQKNQVPTIGTPEAPDRYLSGEDTQALLGGVSSVTLYEWRKKKIITGYRIGNKVMYKYSELIQCGKIVNP
jgi:Helix-turn-helix domain